MLIINGLRKFSNNLRNIQNFIKSISKINTDKNE